MVDADHLRRLRRGVEHWNTWRKDNEGVKPDLSGANLTVIKSRDSLSRPLDAVDLRRPHLRGANLAGADLGRANLNGADLIGGEP